MAKRILPRAPLNRSPSREVNFPYVFQTTNEHNISNTISPQIPANTVFNPPAAYHITHPGPAFPIVTQVQNGEPRQWGASYHPSQQSLPRLPQPTTQLDIPQASHLSTRQQNVTSNMISQSTRNENVVQQNLATSIDIQPAQQPPGSTQINQGANTGQVRTSSSPNAPLNRTSQPAINPIIPVSQDRPRKSSGRGRGRGSSRARSRGSRITRGTKKNLLPNLARSTERANNVSSPPNSARQRSSHMVGIQEILRSNFQQQTEVLKSIRDSIQDSNGTAQDQARIPALNEFHELSSCHPMTTLSNSLCLTYQLFILAAFVGKAPLWFLFPNNEKQLQLLETCAGFLKSNEEGTTISLDQEKVTIREFLEGDTIYKKRGVTIWKHKGLIVGSQGTRKEVFPLEHHLKRVRTRVHDEMTRTALKPFFSNVHEFLSLRLGVHYSYITSNSRHNALQYCMNKVNLGIDPLTDGTWKKAYLKTVETMMEHAKAKMRNIYRKLESNLSTAQLSAIGSYFHNFYYERYGRYVSIFNFDFRPIIPSVLEAYIATKVRCRLADIAAFEAREKSIPHRPFFEVSPCESHFIPLLGDLIKITQKQNVSALSKGEGYACKSERITNSEFTWVKIQYERNVTSSNDFNSSTPDVGVNLLASLMNSDNTSDGNTPNEVSMAVHQPSLSIQYQSSSSSSSIQACRRTSSLSAEHQ